MRRGYAGHIYRRKGEKACLPDRKLAEQPSSTRIDSSVTNWTTYEMERGAEVPLQVGQVLGAQLWRREDLARNRRRRLRCHRRKTCPADIQIILRRRDLAQRHRVVFASMMAGRARTLLLMRRICIAMVMIAARRTGRRDRAGTRAKLPAQREHHQEKCC